MSRASQLRGVSSTSDTEADYSYPSPAKFSDSDNDTAADSGYATTKGGRHADDDWNYVRRTLAKEKPLPPITIRNVHKNINWISFIVLTVVPTLALYGAFTTKLTWQTAVWSVVYYFYSEHIRWYFACINWLTFGSLLAGLGITAGYHRLWAHRAYNASMPLQYFLALGGSGAVEGSIRWWSRGHRAHHRSVLYFFPSPYRRICH
jgi:stearoyl-CoA desaturase (delta-9 desaturase)